jgi:hypothetical protein
MKVHKIIICARPAEEWYTPCQKEYCPYCDAWEDIPIEADIDPEKLYPYVTEANIEKYIG